MTQQGGHGKAQHQGIGPLAALDDMQQLQRRRNQV